jgi:hypothetical protein
MKSFKIVDERGLEYSRQLMTRQEIIDILNQQHEQFKIMYCCPDCRNILTIDDNKMFCENHMCLNEQIYEVQA